MNQPPHIHKLPRWPAGMFEPRRVEKRFVRRSFEWVRAGDVADEALAAELEIGRTFGAENAFGADDVEVACEKG